MRMSIGVPKEPRWEVRMVSHLGGIETRLFEGRVLVDGSGTLYVEAIGPTGPRVVYYVARGHWISAKRQDEQVSV